MRLVFATLNDIRYQAKYGFYFLYAFMTVLYVIILALIPTEYKNIVASIILLTDPATLGFFFIGGIWLLEKDEGVHKFYNISPLRPMEYCLAKIISLAIISTLSGVLIAALSIPANTNYLVLTSGMFIGSCIFTLLGLLLATYAKSVNQYFIISIFPSTVIIIPALMIAFGLFHPLLEIFPATMLWNIIGLSTRGQTISITQIIGLLMWLGITLFIANYRMPVALQSEGGGKG